MSIGRPKGWFTVVDSEAKFTPGPWKICAADPNGCSCGLIWAIPADIVVAAVVSAADENITGGDGIVPGSPELLANARLIAAAPELYEALKKTEAMIFAPVWFKEMRDKAIAKAEGR